MIHSLPDGPLPPAMLDVMLRIAQVVWPWHEIVVLNDAIDWWSLGDVPGCIAALHAKLGEGAPDEIWVVNIPQRPDEDQSGGVSLRTDRAVRGRA